MRKSVTAMIVMAALGAAGCDRTPVGPLEEALRAEALSEESAVATLESLLFSAIRTVHGDHGVTAALALVRPLGDIERRLGEAEVAERDALRAELRDEQMRIVLRVHGADVVDRTIHAVSAQAASLEHELTAIRGAGLAAPELASVMTEVTGLLDQARGAGDDMIALDAATRAASRVERMRGAVAGAVRVTSLDDLFDAAAHRPEAAAFVTEALTLHAAADAAVRSGRSDGLDDAVRVARDARIRAVLAGLGPDAVADMIANGLHRAADQESRLVRAAADRDVSRLQRMNRSASELLRRADRELRRGAAESALDLAGHAADLLNSLEDAFVER